VKTASIAESARRLLRWLTLKELFPLLATTEPEPAEQAERIWHVERNIGLPVKAVLLAVLFYYLFFARWVDDFPSSHQVVLETVQRFFLLYIVFNVGGAFILMGMEQFPLMLVRWVVFTVCLLDLVLLAALTLVTGGFDSILYWGFLGLIVRNTASMPVAPPQLILNLLSCALYLFAGVLDQAFLEIEGEEATTESLLLRVALLLLMAFCCHALQVVIDRERRLVAEAREFTLRQGQLQATARLAAEIAHQLKNPLGIINNAAFTLQRNVKEGHGTITQQIRIIREEIERSDRVLTELMGYAKLVEGKVERLSVSEELDRALDQVFPPAVNFEVKIQRDYAPALPFLMMQRSHLNEVFVNLFQNAREAMHGRGQVHVNATYGEDYSVVITIADNGPGIPAADLDKIFEPYYTTKEKGTGLGLAIVKHNIDMYSGAIRVESELGKGTRFVLKLPARTSMKLVR
jgi:signal transduction histidine kinase